MNTQIEVARTFKHKTHGMIAENVILSAPAGEWTLNGNVLSDESTMFLMNFSLQTFQDAYAGATSHSDAVKKFEDKIERVIDGTMGMRGEGVTALEGEIRIVMYGVIRNNKAAAMVAKHKELKVLSTAARGEALDTIFAKQSDDVRAKIAAKAQVEVDRKNAERKAAIAMAADMGSFEL